MHVVKVGLSVLNESSGLLHDSISRKFTAGEDLFHILRRLAVLSLLVVYSPYLPVAKLMALRQVEQHDCQQQVEADEVTLGNLSATLVALLAFEKGKRRARQMLDVVEDDTANFCMLEQRLFPHAS